MNIVKKIIKGTINRLGYDIRKLPAVQTEDEGRGIDENQKKPTLSKNLLRRKLNSLNDSKLHLGCGPRVLKGWINIDFRYHENFLVDALKYYGNKYYPPELRGNHSDFYAMDIAASPWPFKDNSVDIIFHEDFIEHLNQRDQFCFLAESYRVLKQGAVHRINTPNVEYWLRQDTDFSLGMKTVPIDWVWDRWHHLSVLSPAMLENMARIVGYSKVIFTARDQSSSPLIPLEYRPDSSYAPEKANIFADLIK